MKHKKFWRSHNFRQLQETWESKLKESGFCDIEKSLNGTRVLKQLATNSYRSECNIICENKQRYYELLGHYFHDEIFQDEVHKIVMERRSHGIKIKEIGNELRKLGERNHRDTIRKIIRFYEHKWGIKKK